MPTLSVVVIGRNEAEFIGPCLERARAASTAAGVSAELIYVDSASTDGSAGIARPLADQILERKSSWPPFAGRLLGLRASRGEFVQFLDSDMLLQDEWLQAALGALKGASLDALCGRLLSAEDSSAGSNRAAPEPEWHLIHAQELEQADNGATLFRRAALDKVGGHHPSLVGMDNSEVLIRACSRGLRVARTDRVCARHLRLRRDEGLLDQARRKFRHEYPGSGQALRLALRGPPAYRAALAARISTPAALLAALLAFGGLVLLGAFPWFVAVLGLLFVMAIAVAVQAEQKGSARAGLGSVVDVAGNTLGLVVGAFLPLPSPEAYREELLNPSAATTEGQPRDSIQTARV